MLAGHLRDMVHSAASSVGYIIILFLLCLCSGCGPSAQDRQAEALLAKAQELSLAGGTSKARFEAHAQASRIYREVIASYPATPAAKAAKAGLTKMEKIHEADKKAAAEELAEVYQRAIGSVLEAAQPRK